jgi:hypothetical protein
MMEFFTIDSKLLIEKDVLIIKKLKQDPGKNYWFHSFILIAILIAFQVDKAINEKSSAWIIVLVALMWIYPHLERIFNILFVYKWGNSIRLADITEIARQPIGNELETIIHIRLKSGRQKTLIFRTKENQVEEFIELVQKQKVQPTNQMATALNYSFNSKELL